MGRRTNQFIFVFYGLIVDSGIAAFPVCGQQASFPKIFTEKVQAKEDIAGR
jgi:hypothetical protein